MRPAGLVILCLAYGLGLLVAPLPGGGFWLLAGGAIAAWVIPKRWRLGPRRRIWLLAGLVGVLAAQSLHWRSPQPGPQDVSRLLSQTGRSREEIVLRGTLREMPRLNRAGKAKFWLYAEQTLPFSQEPRPEAQGQPVSGKVYTTVPLLQATGLHPGQMVRVVGQLYLPPTANNPGGFDLRQYLARQGSFAGLTGERVDVLHDHMAWGCWPIREKIARSHMQGAGSPAGSLLSALVLGSRGTDLPFPLKDRFAQVGLAHALAASGFHTSLVLGMVLVLVRRRSQRVQFLVGTLALLGFVGLTGCQPAVLRAALMGFGGLSAMVLGRKVRPLGALLVIATVLLLVQPFWIQDLGFQFSFLATFGLLVTVPSLTKRLDFLPIAIAPLMAVPIAAFLWTVPLQLHQFGILSPYAIPVNLLATPLVSLLCLGGMISALAGLIWLPAGTFLAWLLHYPALVLIALVDWFGQLPGNTYATGTITLVTVVALYGLMVLVWRLPWWQRRWWVAVLLSVGLLGVPVWQAHATQLQVTLLATRPPVMVVQEGSQTLLFNMGDRATVQQTLIPFLHKSGVNHIDRALDPALDLHHQAAWQTLQQRLPIRQLYSVPAPTTPLAAADLTLQASQTIGLKTVQVQVVQPKPLVVTWQTADQAWLWLGKLAPEAQVALLPQLDSRHPVLIWGGHPLAPELVQRLQPQAAIATHSRLAEQTARLLAQHEIPVHLTGQDGAIQWTATTGLQTTQRLDVAMPPRD